MDLVHALPEQEQAAGNQDQVAPGDRVTEYRERRRGQANDLGRHQLRRGERRKCDPGLRVGEQFHSGSGEEQGGKPQAHGSVNYRKVLQGRNISFQQREVTLMGEGRSEN